MRYFSFYTLIGLLFCLLACSERKEETNTEASIDTSGVLPYAFIDSALDRSVAIYTEGAKQYQNVNEIPRSITNDGKPHLVPRTDWTSGFYAGSLWYLYEYTKDDFWLERAKKWTANLEPIKDRRTTHDIGFIIYCSFGNGYRLTKDSSYLNIIHHTSGTLIKRFNEKVGCTKSWNRYKFSEKWQFPVIIDNMMNLEILFFSSRSSGDSTFSAIANRHAQTVIKHHFRDDYSSYHVVDYDSTTGEVIQKNTHQGIADSSSWARGQAWGLYGFTFAYRETGNASYLTQAEHIADYIMNNPLHPADQIPLWDYMDSREDAPRDASAAAIVASALLELSQLPNVAEADKYIEYAAELLRTLSSPRYLNEPGKNHHFILLHCTGNHPNGSEIDLPLNYGDYYFLEALLKLKNITNK